MPKQMIFHHPAPLPSELTSGSRVRPVKMKQAFESLGYEVFLVAGSGRERRAAIKVVRELVRQGTQFDFVYSEPPTAPIVVVNRDLPSFWVDLAFLHWCKRASIPVGLFYRDVYWRFELFRTVEWYKRLLMIPLYWFEWLQFRQCVSHLFIPSLDMAAALPTRWPESHFSALPPGCEPTVQKDGQNFVEPLNLFYVGGIVPPLYDVSPLLAATSDLPGITLTFCCRETEWAEMKNYYQPFGLSQLKVVHVHGKELVQYFVEADIFCLIRKPHPYLKFAMPVKIFESLGYGLPLITTAGTATADFIEREGIGWVVANSTEFRELISRLQNNPDEVEKKRVQAETTRYNHTWQRRAQAVVDVMKQYCSKSSR